MPGTGPASELVELFASVLPDDPAVERRKVFGFPAAVTAGYMFAGVYHDSILIRLPKGEYERFMALPGATPFEPMPGRQMNGFAVFPDTMLSDSEGLRTWVQTAFEQATLLPPKLKKAPKAPKAGGRARRTA